MTKEKQFISKIANLEIGILPSVGAFEAIIKEARKLESKTKLHPDCIGVLGFLNKVANKRFSSRQTNLKHINARLNEGVTAQQLKQIIELKVYQWSNDFEMKVHLNPETLFRPSKIEKYLQEVEDIMKNPQKFKQHVERNNTEEQRQRDRDFDPLA